MLEHVLQRARRRTRDAVAEERFPLEGGARLQRRRILRHELAGCWARFLTVSKRGSRASSGRPVSSHSAVQKCGVLAEMYRLPFFVGCRPVIPPERMSRATSRALAVRPDQRVACIARALRSKDTPTYCAWPVRLRSNRAAETANASIEAE